MIFDHLSRVDLELFVKSLLLIQVISESASPSFLWHIFPSSRLIFIYMPPRALLALICQTPASRFVKRGEFFSATVRPSSQFSANLKVVELLFLPLLLINQTLFCFWHFFFRMLTSENMISIKRQHKRTHSGETLYIYANVRVFQHLKLVI